MREGIDSRLGVGRVPATPRWPYTLVGRPWSPRGSARLLQKAQRSPVTDASVPLYSVARRHRKATSVDRPLVGFLELAGLSSWRRFGLKQAGRLEGNHVSYGAAKCPFTDRAGPGALCPRVRSFAAGDHRCRSRRHRTPSWIRPSASQPVAPDSCGLSSGSSS
jgi:hypothetical protein